MLVNFYIIEKLKFSNKIKSTETQEHVISAFFLLRLLAKNREKQSGGGILRTKFKWRGEESSKKGTFSRDEST